MVFLFFALLFTAIYAGYIILTTESTRRTLSFGVEGELMRVYGSGEKNLFYIDKSVEHATYNAVNWLGEKGGFGFDEPKCGNFKDYILWADGEKTCFPDVRNNFISVFKSFFGDYLIGNDIGISIDDYEFAIDESSLVNIHGNVKRKAVIERKLIKYSYDTSFVREIPFGFNEYDKLIKKIEGLLACLQNKGSNSGEDINGCGFDLEYGRFADVLVFDIKQGELLGKDVAIKFAVDVGSGGKEIKEPVKGLFE